MDKKQIILLLMFLGKDQKIVGTISMRRDGYIQKGEIEISGQNSRVFSIENPNNNSIIEKVEGNKIILNRFEGNTVNFELPLKYVYEGNISKDILSNNLTAKFRATYVSPEGNVERNGVEWSGVEVK